MLRKKEISKEVKEKQFLMHINLKKGYKTISKELAIYHKAKKITRLQASMSK